MNKNPFPAYATRENFLMPLVVVIGGTHILALALAPFTYTQIGLISFFAMYVLTMFGITAGYHRMMQFL